MPKPEKLVIPHLVEAEEAVLGSLITNNELFDRVSDFLAAEHFYVQANQKIYDVIRALIRSGREASDLTVKAHLPADAGADGMNTEQYVRHLMLQATTLVSVIDFARVIVDMAARRDLIAVSEELRQRAYQADIDDPPHEQIEEAERKLALLKSGLNGSSSHTALRVTCVNNVEPEAIKYIWPGRLARGHVTLLSGAPGTGKSQISDDITARITTGTAWPDSGVAPLGRVVRLSAEDTVKDVIRPRLEAAGADLQRVHVIELAIGKDGKERTFNLQQDIAGLQRVVTEMGDVALVIIDPITSYMGSNVYFHRTTDVRAVLEPLARFADEAGVAVLAISHPPKAAQASAINSVTGSLAFVAAARMVFITADEAETERRLLLSVKNNLGAKAPGLGYRMEQRIVSKGIVSSHIAWDSAPVTVTADEALRQSGADTGKFADAKEFLLDMLSSGRISAETVTAAAERQDISKRTLRRARKDLKVKAEKSKGSLDGGWLWSLPDEGGHAGQFH